MKNKILLAAFAILPSILLLACSSYETSKQGKGAEIVYDLRQYKRTSDLLRMSQMERDLSGKIDAFLSGTEELEGGEEVVNELADLLSSLDHAYFAATEIGKFGSLARPVLPKLEKEIQSAVERVNQRPFPGIARSKDLISALCVSWEKIALKPADEHAMCAEYYVPLPEGAWSANQ